MILVIDLFFRLDKQEEIYKIQAHAMRHYKIQAHAMRHYKNGR